MRKRRTYDGAFKAKVVLELIRGRKSLTELSVRYDLNPNQIKNWKSAFLKQAASVFEDKRRAGKRQRD